MFTNRHCQASAAALSPVGFGGFRVLMVATALLVSNALAQTIWDGGGGDDNWGTAANWNNNTAPVNPSLSILRFAGSTRLTPNVNAPWTVNGLKFDSGASAFTLGGSAITVNTSSGIVNASGSLQTVNNAITLGAEQTWQTSSTGNLTVAGAVTGGASKLTTDAASGTTITIGGILGGTGNFTTMGAGTTVLSATNTYTGTTTVAGGTLSISSEANLGANPGALNAAQLVLAGGTLNTTATLAIDDANRGITIAAAGGTFNVNSGTTVTYTGNTGILDGTGELIKTGAGTLVDGGTGTNTHTGNITVNQGTLQFAKTAAGVSGIWNTSAITVASGATLQLNNASLYTSETVGSIAGAGTIDANGGTPITLKVSNTGRDSEFSGVLSNTGVAGGLVLTKLGTGNLTLSGSNSSYSGVTTVSQGTLQLNASAPSGANGSLGNATSAVVVNDASTAANNTALLIGASGVTVGRDITVANSGTGTTTLGGNITSGTGTFSGNIALNKATTLSADGTSAITFGTGVISGSGNITKAGTGTVVLSGTNTFTGNTTVSAGTLRGAGNTQALGTGAATVTLAGGNLELANDTGLNFARNTTVSSTSTVTSDRLNPGAGVTHTLGTLSIGSQTLNVGAGANRTSGTAGITFGATTLTGNSTFDVGSNAQLTLGALNGGGTARTITKADAGTLIFNATPGAAVTAGSNLVVTGGIAQVDTAGALTSTNSYGVTVNSTTASGNAAFNLNNVNQTIASLTFGGTGAGASAVNSVATGTGTLTLGGNVTYDATNNPGGATISGNLALGANRTFRVGDSSNTGAELTISAIVSGTGFGITKEGAGALTLTGANTLTGAVTVNNGELILSGANGALASAASYALKPGGTLTLDNSSGTGNIGNRLASVGLTANGGTLNFTHDGAAGTNYGETIGALTANAGDLKINLSQAGVGQTSAVTVSSITRGAGGTMLFSGTGLGANNRNEFLVSTPAGILTNGIIPGAMMTTDGGSTYNLVTHSLVGGTTILPYAGYSTGTAAATPWAAAINARPAADQTLGAGYSLNSLVLDSGIDLLLPAADRTLTFTGGSGMIVQTGGASVIDGTAASGFEHVLAFGGTEGIFSILGSGSLTINRGNTNNITGTGGITKTGSGTLVINARSTNSGTTRLNDGTLRAQTQTSALGAGTLQLNQGTLELAGAGAVNFARNTTVNGDVTIKSDKLANGAGVTHTLGTLAIGAQTLTIDKGGFVTSGTAGVTFGATTLSGDSTFRVASGAQLTLGALTSGGSRTITKADAGTLIFNQAAGGAVTAGSSLVVNGGIAQINSATALTSGNSYGVVVNSTTDSGTAAFNLNNINHTIGTLTFGGARAGANAINSVATGTGTLTLGGNVTYDATNHPGGATIAGKLGLGANRTFTVGDSSNTAAELSISAVVSGGGFGITKSGTGTLVLSGTNTYTGATAISQGTLQLNANAPSAADGTLGNSATAVTLNDANTGANATGLLIGTSGVTVARAITVANSGTGTTTLGGNFATAGTSSFTGNVTLNKATTFAAEGASNIAFSTGAISGTGNITKTGDGTLTLSGNNSTFTGAIAVTAGTLNAQGSTNALGTGTTGTTVSSGASLALQGGLSFYNGPLSLAGTGVSGVGALTNVSGSNTWNNTGTNAVSLSDHATIGSQTGTLTIGAARPTFTISGHTPPTETSYVTLGSKTLTFSGTGAVVVNDRIQDFSGQTAGTSYLNASAVAYKPETTASGNIIVNMSGAGSVTYAANANTYTGTTTVQAGTLILATKGGTAAPHDGVTDSFHAINGPLTIGSNSGITTATVQLGNGGVANELIGIGSTVTLFKDGTLNVNNVSQTIDALTFNGGAVTLGTGTLYLNNDVTVNASDGNTATISGAGGRLSMTLNRDGTADTGPDATRTFTTVGHVNNTYDLTIGGIIQNGNLVKAGNGTMMLNNNNTYTGTTSVTEGILNIQTGTDGSDRSGLGEGGGTSAKGTSVSSGATLQLEHLGPPLTGIAVTSEHLTISGSGMGGLGALNSKSGDNTWGATGNTFINLAADARINSTAGTLTISGNIGSDANNALTVGGAGNTTISGNIATGSGGTTTVTKDGGGTLILSGNNSFQGATNVTAGIVRAQHNNGLGAVSTGANGTFVTDGAELQLSGIITIGGEALELRGAGISGTSGALHNVSGSNTFGGVVTLATPSTIRNSAGGTTLTLSGGTTSANDALTINSTGDTTISGNMTNGTGTLTKDGSGRLTFSGTTGTVGQTNLNVGSMTVGAGSTTALNTAEFSSATSTTLLIASNGTVNAVYGSGNTNFNGVIDAASAGAFTATSTGTTSSGLTFGASFTATGLTLNLGGSSKGGSDLSKYFRLELSGVTIGVGTLHITGDTILDFNGASSTFLSSNYLTIDAGVNIIVEGWISAANGVWRAINEVNSGTLSGPNDQVGGTPLSQISFTGYSGMQTTWVFGNHDGWFDREIRPTPEPSTYGAIMIGAALAFIGYRRFVRRKAPPAA
jgi:autotransporter-associated beta strand protein